MSLSDGISIFQTRKFWRFVISELKQSEANYEHMGHSYGAANDQQSASRFYDMSRECGKVAREISNQMDKRGR